MTMNHDGTNRCPVCQAADVETFFELNKVPTYCNLIHRTYAEAMAVRRGDIRLGFCRSCGHIFNAAFDPNLILYTQSYENSLHFSPRFQRYTEELVADLVQRYDLHHKVIIDVGCGKGDFLRMMCAAGDNRGIGFDPSYIPDETESDTITVVRDYYSEAYSNYYADFICCRHVLEHIEEPEAFLKSIRKSIRNPAETRLFFEVPNSLYTLRDLGIWDIIYEHCAYFTPNSLAHLFRRCGFDVLSLHEGYGGQFLTIETVVSATVPSPSFEPELDLETLEHLTQAFSRSYRQKIDYWSGMLQQLAEHGKRVIVWGAGSKGVTLLNVLQTEDMISYVVDINPRKIGAYISGTGQQIVSVDFLRRYLPDAILVMNPIYVDEIRQMLCDWDLKVELLTA